MNSEKKQARPSRQGGSKYRGVRKYPSPTPKKNSSDKIKVCFLGGLEAVGEKNMAFIEYKNQIAIFDAGLMFPELNMPGVDYVIPNVEYLAKNKKKIVGLFITHGHYDHIGAIPHIMEKIGNPIIYAAPLTKAIIIKRQTDFPNAPKLRVIEIDPNKMDEIRFDKFKVHPFHINHNIPDSLGFAIETDLGKIFYVPDFKFDFTPIVDKPADLKRITKLAAKDPLLLMSDSTGSEDPGYAPSERKIFGELERLFEKAKGTRIIASTFASLLNRVQQIIWLSEKFGRKVVIDGYSMKTNVAIARENGYLDVKKNTIISPQEAIALPKSQLTIMCTGSQGEGNAVLMRMVNHEHRHFKVEKGDTIIFSSSAVPGNELSVSNLADNLNRQGANVYHYKMMDIHTSGHGSQEDIKLLMSLVRPKFFMPIHGKYSMLKKNTELAEQTGIKKENIVIANNGQIVEISKDSIFVTKEEVPANNIMVDGLGVGDVSEVVLRDRSQLAQDGTIIMIVMIDGKKGEIRGEPEIMAKGFVYAKGAEEKEFQKKIKDVVREVVSKSASKDHTTNWDYLKNNLRDKVGSYIFKISERRPIILPFVIEV